MNAQDMVKRLQAAFSGIKRISDPVQYEKATALLSKLPADVLGEIKRAKIPALRNVLFDMMISNLIDRKFASKRVA